MRHRAIPGCSILLDALRCRRRRGILAGQDIRPVLARRHERGSSRAQTGSQAKRVLIWGPDLPGHDRRRAPLLGDDEPRSRASGLHLVANGGCSTAAMVMPAQRRAAHRHRQRPRNVALRAALGWRVDIGRVGIGIRRLSPCPARSMRALVAAEPGSFSLLLRQCRHSRL